MSIALPELKDKLDKEYPYRIELHAHTKPVSRCSEVEPARLIEAYKNAGADGVCITNHFYDDRPFTEQDDPAEFYLSGYREAKAAGEKRGVAVYLGLEIRFPEVFCDYLVYGIDEDYIRKAWPYVKKDLASFCRDCRTEDTVIVQAHPYRKSIPQDDGTLLDGFEVFNLHPDHNSQIGLAAKYSADHGGLVIGGTDFHHDGHEGLIFTRTRTLPKDSLALARILRSGDYLLEMGGSLILP